MFNNERIDIARSVPNELSKISRKFMELMKYGQTNSKARCYKKVTLNRN
jgi:hypothetical protein